MGLPPPPAPRIPTEHGDIDRSFARRWKYQELFRHGFVPLPKDVLRHYARLDPPIDPVEMMFVLHLMEFKWGAEAPYPTYARLSERMGVTTKAVRRYAKRLEDKGYLERRPRPGQSSEFVLEPLFDALRNAQTKDVREARQRKANIGT